MPEKLRCAVIGVGSIGWEHLQSLVQCPQATPVALAENHPTRAKEAADRFRIPRIYTDYRDLLDQPDIDAVTIATPNYLHARIAIDALQARKHVFLEKPMALTYREAVKIAETSRKLKRVFSVAHNLRFRRDSQVAKTLISRGDLGEVYHVRGTWLRRCHIPRIGSWFTQKQLAGGGCLLDLGVHVVDLCLHLLGEFEVKAVCGQTFAKLGPQGKGEFDWGRSEIDPKKPFTVEDYAVALLKLRSGKTVWVEVSWAAYHPGDARELGIDVLGSQAGLSLFPARLFRPNPGGYETVHLSAPTSPHPEDRIQHFISCVLRGRNPLVPIEESLKVQQILDAIYASAASGKEVRTG